MPKLKVYISSTFRDLEDVRKKIIDRIQAGLTEHFEIARIMEIMHGDSQNRSNHEICIHEVSDADLYILVLGKRYGSHPDIITHRGKESRPNVAGLSYTELEYDAACEAMQSKFYGIYKFTLTDDFLTSEKLAASSDLADPVKQQKYDAFKVKLDKADTPIKIDSALQLEKEINNKLTEYFLETTLKQDLALSPSDYNSIDRNEQINIILQEKEKLSISRGVYALLIGLEDKADCPHEFTLHINKKLTKSDPRTTKLEYLTSSIISNTSGSEDSDRVMNKTLAEAFVFITGEVAENADFEILKRNLEINTDIKNVFIGFEVYASTDMVPGKTNFLKVISLFIERVNQVLLDTKFGYNFYFLIYIYSDQPEISLEFTGWFSNVKCITIHKLPKVLKEDTELWLNEVKSKNPLTYVQEQDVNTLFKMIFLDPGKFPTKYKRCLELVKNRTK